MINIIKQRLKEQRNSVIIYLLSLSGYALLMISMFPQMKKMDIDALIRSYPEEIAKFFGDSGMATYSTIEGFISMEFLSFFFMLILTFYIGSVAGTAIAGQIEKRTIDFNLSQPISRTKIILAETTTAVFYIALIVAATSLSILLFTKIFNIDLSFTGLMAFTFMAALFAFAHYGIALFFSSILRSKSTVMLLTVGISLGSYIFLSLTRLIEKLKDYADLSIYTLYDPEKLLKHGVINWHQVEILLAIFIVGLILSTIIFNKKDV